MPIQLKVLQQSPRTFLEWSAWLEKLAGIGANTTATIANNGTSEPSPKGSYYPSAVNGSTEIEAGEEATYEVTKFSLYKGKDEDEKALVLDKQQVKWVMYIEGVALKDNLVSYITLRGFEKKEIEESPNDFMAIEDVAARTKAVKQYAITAFKVSGEARKDKTKLTVKFSKWLDGHKVHIEAYRRKPDLKPAKAYVVTTAVKAQPEIIQGYWVNDKRENITNKTIGYKDTVYMCLQTLGMKDKVVTTELWEEGVNFFGTMSDTDYQIRIDKGMELKLTDRLSYKKLELPEEDSEEYKKQREGIIEGEKLELYFALPRERETLGYQSRYGAVLHLTTKEIISTAYFAKALKQDAIKDGTVSEEESTQTHIHVVRKGDTLSKIATKYDINWKKLAEHNDIKKPYPIKIDQQINLPADATIPEGTATAASTKATKQETFYERIESGTLGSEVHLVVETANLHGKTVDIEAFDKEKLLAEDDETPIKLLQDDTEVTKLENIKIDDTGKAIVKVKLRPKSDDDYKKLKEKFKVKNTYKNSATGEEKLLFADDQALSDNPDDYTLVKEGNPIKAKLFLKVKCQGDDTKHEKVFLDGEEFAVKESLCYCLKMALVDTPCSNNGKLITEKHYEKLSKDLGVEKNVFKAVAKVESGGRNSFISTNPNKSKILYERHKAYKHVKAKYGKVKADELSNKNSNLVHPKWSKKAYKGGQKEHQRLNDAEKLIGERGIPIMSCSWGKFQVLGEYYTHIYNSPEELEKAQNLCEIQQFRYFKAFLEDEKPKIIPHMKKKNWNKIAEYYNGKGYAKNNYHTKMKQAYEKYNKDK